MKPTILPIGKWVCIALLIGFWGNGLWANAGETKGIVPLKVLEQIDAKEILQPLEELELPDKAIPWVGWQPKVGESVLGQATASNILVSSFLTTDELLDSLFCKGENEDLEVEGLVVPEGTTGDSSTVFQGSIGGLYAEKARKVRRAREVIAKAKQIGNFISCLTGEDLVTFPLAIPREIGNVSYTMAIGGMRLYPTYSELEVYVEIDAPTMPYPLLFGSENIKFTKQGGIVGDTRLSLLADYFVPLFKRKAGVLFRGSSEETDGCYVDISCDGFEGLGLDAHVFFSRAWLVPLDDQGVEISETCRKVHGRIQGSIAHWEDFTVEIESMDNFAVKGLEDIRWEVLNMGLDLSDITTPESVKFPLNYNSPYLSGEKVSPLWRGFYIGELKVVLPPKLTGKSDVTIGVYNSIIDETGFSGRVFKTPVLPLKEGNLNKWAFSIDTLELGIVQQQFEHVRFTGGIQLPLLNKKADSTYVQTDSLDIDVAETVAYEAFINPGNEYNLLLSNNQGTKPVGMWGATIAFKPNCSLELKYKEEKFNVTATLHGFVHIDRDFGAASLNIDSLDFNDLRLSTEAPHLSIGHLYVPTAKVDMGSFAITVDDFLLDTTLVDKPVISFLATADVTTKKLDISVTGGFKIKGELEEVNGRQKWKNKHFSMDAFRLDASFPGVERLVGGLVFKKGDAQYGNYFKGLVQIEFEGLDAVISAAGQFGKINKPNENYNYFFVDAMAVFGGGGLPAIGPIGIKAFGGGIYHNMMPVGEQDLSTSFGLPQYVVDTDAIVVSMEPGETLSGAEYVPNPSISLGLKAEAVLATHKMPRSFNSNLRFKMEFGKTEGADKINLQRVLFEGNGRFMADIDLTQIPIYEAVQENTDSTLPPPDPPIPSIPAAVRAYVLLDYEVGKKKFSANLDVAVDVGGVLVGKGYVDMLLSDSLWYIKIGEPDIPNYFKIKVPFAKEPLVDIKNYFMMGSQDLPDMPPPPAFFTENNKGKDYYQQRDDIDFKLTDDTSTGSLGLGGGPKNKGFILGAQLKADVDINFLILYASLGVDVGFDIGIVDKTGTLCNGSTPGINGWYASGQAWAYFHGDVGAQVKIFGKKKKFSLLKLQAGLLVQAKLPNPFWAKGDVDVKVEILGGLISKKIEFEMEVGEKCEYSIDFAEINVISSITPADSTFSVSVAEIPRVSFELPIEQAYTITEDDGTDDVGTYQVIIKHITIEANGQEVESKYELSEDKMYADVQPKDGYTNQFLPANANITVTAQVAFQELINNQWKDVKNEQGQLETDERSVSFQTGDIPNVILPENILASYPIDRQYNFYRNEYSKGKIKLKTSQEYLFDDVYNGYQIYAKFSQNGNADLWSPSSYINGAVTFDITEDALKKQELYKMELIASPVSGSDPTQYVLYTLHFRTSKFNTFKEKIDQMVDGFTYTYDEVTGTFPINLDVLEPFDDYELNGVDKYDINPLMEWKGLLETSSWYKNDIKPLVYDHFPKYPVSKEDFKFGLENRTEEPYGLPPIWTVIVAQTPTSIQLTDAEIQQGVANVYSNSQLEMSYFVREIVKMDHDDFKSQVKTQVNKLMEPYIPGQANSLPIPDGYYSPDAYILDLESTPDYAAPIYWSYPFPDIKPDEYEIKVKYLVPQMLYSNSEKTIKLIKE